LLKILEPTPDRLKARLQELDFDFKKSLGQNFLISDHVIGKILTEAENVKFQHLIEIGPGLGSLTDYLIQLSPEIKLIELDRRLCEYWRNKNAEVIEADALRWDWSKLNSLEDVLLVSNLPYQISSSLVIDRCEGPSSLKWMILMFQKEVAQRLMAEVGSEHYGMLSVMAQLHFKIRKVTDAAPRDFQPPPKVASRVLYFERLAAPAVETKVILNLLKQGFAQRRKKLVNNLKGLLANEHKVEDLEQWLEGEDLSAQARAEELSPEQWLKLAKWIKK
jgi:16S rRNA (adenine1518-N6/adenine1519-N6)-dimethyltransferase